MIPEQEQTKFFSAKPDTSRSVNVMLSKKHTQFMFNTNNNDINNGTTLAHELIMKGGGESYVHIKHVLMLNCCGKFKGL